MKKHINSLMALSMAAMPAIAQTTDWQHFNVNNSNLPRHLGGHPGRACAL